MVIVVHKKSALIISIALLLLHYRFAETRCPQNLLNSVVDKGSSFSFPNLYPDDNVMWQVFPSNGPGITYKDITVYDNTIRPPFIGIYEVNKTHLTILNATATTDDQSSATAGLYIASYQNASCASVATLTVIDVPPTCDYYRPYWNPDKPMLTCSIIYAHFYNELIIPIMTWKDSSGKVVLTDGSWSNCVSSEANFGLQTCASYFSVPIGDSSNYTCMVKFDLADPNQPLFTLFNTPNYTAACYASVPTTTADSTTRITVTTATKLLTSTATTTMAALSTTTTPNLTTTPLVTTMTKLLTSIETTMAVTPVTTEPNTTAAITQNSVVSNDSSSSATSQLSANPTPADTSTMTTATAPIQVTTVSSIPSITDTAVTPPNTPITIAKLETGTVGPPTTMPISNIPSPKSPVTMSESGVSLLSSSESTTLAESQPSTETNGPGYDHQAQAVKIVLGVVLASLLLTLIVCSCWCYCYYFPFGTTGTKRIRQTLLVRQIFFFWRREPPVKEIYRRSYYPVSRRPQVVCENPCRYPALRKTFQWREPDESGVF